MSELRDLTTTVAVDPIGPLVPWVPVSMQILALAGQSQDDDAAVAAAAGWLFQQLDGLVNTIMRESISVEQAAREGFSADAIRADLEFVVRRVLAREHPGVVVDDQTVDHQVDRLLSDGEFDRAMAWALLMISESTLKPVLIPVRPFWNLRAQWLDEIEADRDTAAPTSEYVKHRRLGVAVLDGLCAQLEDERVSLAQAARETGLSPDDLLGLLHDGRLVGAGDARTPRIRRGEFFTARFQRLAWQLREQGRGDA